MLKAAIEKIASLVENKTYEIEGRTYSDKPLNLIEEPIYHPRKIALNGLDGLCDLIKREIPQLTKPLFVRVESYNQVDVFTTYGDRFNRDFVYEVISDTPRFDLGWRDHESAMISLRSQFIQNKGTEYLLKLLSSIRDESSVSTNDNGLTQTVEATKGIALKEKVTVEPIVKLRPYRTFIEVEQPESEFLVRLREGGDVGLFEADGGMWKLKSKKTIKEYLVKELDELIQSRDVIVII